MSVYNMKWLNPKYLSHGGLTPGKNVNIFTSEINKKNAF